MEDLLKKVTFHGNDSRSALVSQRKDSGAVAFGLYAHGNLHGVANATEGMPEFLKYVKDWFQSSRASCLAEIWQDGHGCGLLSV